MPIKLDFTDGTVGAVPIVLSEIRKLVNNYRTDMRQGDTVSAWVSAKEIKELLDQNNADGIRLYFGRYPKNDNIYPDKHNVILVSTKSSDPKAESTYLNSIDQLNDDKRKGLVNSATLYLTGDYTGKGDDAIPLCPQNCPSTRPPL